MPAHPKIANAGYKCLAAVRLSLQDSKPLPFAGKAYGLVGLLAVCLVLGQALGDWHWRWLSGWQSDDVYKQISGGALLAVIGYQWRYSILRSRSQAGRMPVLGERHKWLGAVAPVVFYFHSQTLGYAYTMALTTVFFVILLSGLCNAELTGIRKPWFRPLWILTHVGLSSALLCLIGYHLYITYVFE